MDKKWVQLEEILGGAIQLLRDRRAESVVPRYLLGGAHRGIIQDPDHGVVRLRGETVDRAA